MRLAPLSPASSSVTRSTIKWSNELGIPLELRPTHLNSIIVLGNGVPDNIVALIIAHKLDGKVSIGLVKPKEATGPSSLPHALRLVREGRVGYVLFLVDQEGQGLDELKESVEKALRDHGVSYEPLREERRVYEYECSLGHVGFKLIVVVNGLDEPSYTKHCIEDHLLETARRVIGNQHVEACLKRAEHDPKRAWRMLGEHRERVYKALKSLGLDSFRQLLPQHVEAFDRLSKALGVKWKDWRR